MAPQTIPVLVGHRGWPTLYPENTLEGFTAAVKAGARRLECDVQLSADGVPFVSHDDSLERTAGLDRNITNMNAVELGTITVGERQRFDGRYANVKLPRLDTLIAWLQTQSEVNLFVEIKRQSLRHHGTDLVVGKIMQEIQSARQQCIMISFDHACLTLARQQGAPAIGWAVERTDDETRQQADTLQPDYMFTDEALFTRVHTALPGSWRWVSYHTENAERALELACQGANFVETNDIGAMLHTPEFAST
ncbi:MAG: glycerophosphodiester phosphodiesterase family protein [Gammaproteobacteria bacterium]